MARFSALRLPESRSATLAIRAGTVLLLALSVGLGCGSDSPTAPPPPPPDTSRIVTLVAGNQQTVKVGEAVPVAPSLRVANSSGGPLAGVAVTFAVASGGGSLQGANTTTGSDGIASVGAWTLGERGVNTLSATVAGATSGSPALFSATAEELVIVTIHAGNEQSVLAGQPVPVAPAVLVANSVGTPVVGVAVTFAVASGGGSLEAATTTTGADGVGSVGSWTLGEVGANTLTVTVEGATSGSPALFSATGEEIVIAPTADTTLSGQVSATRLIVPAGITVTVTEGLELTTDGLIDIQGTILGECVPIQLETSGPLTIQGTIDNSCAAGDPLAELILIGLDGFDVDGATIQSSGDVLVTNDPTLTDSDFPAPVAGSPSATNGVANAGSSYSNAPPRAALGAPIGCRAQSTTLRPFPAKARKGTDRSGTGLPGADGSRWKIDCRGEILVRGGVTYQGQHGGDGGTGTHSPGVIDALAIGGLGGRGGYMILRATRLVTFEGILNEMISGDGGRGGNANATSNPSAAGLEGPGAVAIGGDGGQPGLLSILAPTIVFNEPLDLVIGSAGDGGDALATSTVGWDAIGVRNAQAGGPAWAQGGSGGGTPDLTLATRNGVDITGVDNARVSGGDAGDGGTGAAVGGTGGNGTPTHPDGGAGGDTEARGGRGGTALLRDQHMQLFGVGGNGGDARLSGALGRGGKVGCRLPDAFHPGGSGGAGGSLTGQHGEPGTGVTPGVAGLIHLTTAGNGGDAGHGEPKGASGGGGGAQSMSKPPQTVGESSVAGARAFSCVHPNLQSFETTVHESANLDPNAPCERLGSSFSLINFSPHPVTFTIKVNDLPTFRTEPTEGEIPAAPGPTTPWSSVPIEHFADICSMVVFGPDVFGEIEITFTIGNSSITKFIPVEYRFR